MTSQVKNNEDDEVVPETEVLQREYEFIPNALCRFKQRGPYLVCVSCELQHAVYIGMDKMMVGEDEEGKPLIEKRTIGV